MIDVPIYYAYVNASGIVRIGRKVPQSALVCAQSPSRALLRRAADNYTYRDPDTGDHVWMPLRDAVGDIGYRMAFGELAVHLNTYLAIHAPHK